jgi:hypothetical protein
MSEFEQQNIPVNTFRQAVNNRKRDLLEQVENFSRFGDAGSGITLAQATPLLREYDLLVEELGRLTGECIDIIDINEYHQSPLP